MLLRVRYVNLFKRVKLSRCRKDKHFLLQFAGKVDHCSLDCAAKKTTTNITRSGMQQTFVELVCSPYSLRGLQQQAIYLSAVNIFSSIRAFLGNSPILVTLDKESPSIRRPNSCKVVWQQLICWLVLLVP